MRPLGITTDSTSDMTLVLSRRLDIPVTPIIVRVGGQEVETRPDMDRDAYFSAIDRDGLSGTAAVSPAHWAAAYRDLAERAASQLAVTLSQGMSATWQNAKVAGASEGTGRVSVFDSGTVFAGLLSLVLGAGEMAAGGADLAEVRQWLEAARPRTHTYLLSPNLGMLRRIGRVGDVMPVAGKPWAVVKIEEGLFVPKSTHENVEAACAWILRDLEPALDDAPPLRLVVDHGRAPGPATMVADFIGRGTGVHPLTRIDDGPIMPVLADGFGGVALSVGPLPVSHTARDSSTREHGGRGA